MDVGGLGDQIAWLGHAVAFARRHRQVGLCHTAAYILGMPARDEPPAIVVEAGGSPILEPYVCIATQAAGQNKYWNNQLGWESVIHHLKTAGYHVICIDKERVHGRGMIWNHIPHGAEDQTGTGRSRSAPVGCVMRPSSSDCRAACPGWPGRPAARSC